MSKRNCSTNFSHNLSPIGRPTPAVAASRCCCCLSCRNRIALAHCDTQGLDPHRLTNARTAPPQGSFNPILSPSWSTGRRRRPRRARRPGHVRTLLHHPPIPTRTNLRQRRRGPGHEPGVSIAAARSASATRVGRRAEAALAARKGANGASKSPSVPRTPRRSCKITRQ